LARHAYRWFGTRIRIAALIAGISSIVAPPGVAREAQAHAVGVSRGTYLVRRVADHVVVNADLVFAKADAPLLTAGEELMTVTADDVACAPEAAAPGAPTSDEDDGIRVHLGWICGDVARVVVVWDFLARDDAMGGSHRHVATVSAGAHAPVQELLFAGHDRLSIEVPLDVASSATAAAGLAPSFGSFVLLGLRHVLTGADHLAFILGLALGGGSLVELVRVVTAFTVAHSFTLALATLGIVAPSARIVEPLVALSVVYIGAESFFRRRPAPSRRSRSRWPIAFAFGLVHGLAFADALKAIGLHRGALASALVGFNGGVEIAQLIALALFVPAIRLVQRWARPERSEAWLRLASAAVALAGAVWFVLRVV
jgi:hydrogenase/urease accessory protein HupE